MLSFEFACKNFKRDAGNDGFSAFGYRVVYVSAGIFDRKWLIYLNFSGKIEGVDNCCAARSAGKSFADSALMYYNFCAVFDKIGIGHEFDICFISEFTQFPEFADIEWAVFIFRDVD